MGQINLYEQVSNRYTAIKISNISKNCALMSKDDKKIAAEASESIDRIEELLSVSLSFAGRYLTTIWHYLLIPSLSTKKMRGEISRRSILSPLSFLTSSLLIFSLSYFRVLKELLSLNWISEEFKSTITRVSSYHDSIAESAFAFQFADALFLMVPLVLFVALFAKINELVSILVRKRTTISQQLSSSSYLVGTIASMIALWSLPILYFMANYNALETTSILEEVIGILIIILAILSIFSALFRYLQESKNQFFNSWALSCLVFALATFLQVVVMRITLKLFLLSGV